MKHFTALSKPENMRGDNTFGAEESAILLAFYTEDFSIAQSFYKPDSAEEITK